jgi:hypothetical protein
MGPTLTDTRKETEAQLAAREIYQRVLDTMTEAMLKSDNQTLANGMTYPFRFGTLQEDFIIESSVDWLNCTDRFAQTLKAQGVNHFIRLCTEADFLSENYISGRHVSHTMRNAIPVIPPYENRATLTRVDGEWRFSDMDAAIRNNRWPISTVYVDVKRSGERKPRPDTTCCLFDIRRSSAAPKVLYQQFLDELSAINMSGDFDAWCEKCEFPHSVHIEHVDEIMETPEDIRPFLDMVSERIETLNVDKLTRTAEHAEFISGTQLCGYHRTVFTSKGEVKLGPFLGRYILTRTGTSWRMSSVTNSVTNPEFPYAQPVPGDALVSLREIQERIIEK